MPINSFMWTWVTTEATQIWVSSNILHLVKFMAQDLQIPGRKMLPGFPQAGLLPHCIVGDEAFPLRPDMMKPFPRGQRGNNLPEDQLVLITGCYVHVGSQKMPLAFWFKAGGYLTDGCTCQTRMQSRSYRQQQFYTIT